MGGSNTNKYLCSFNKIQFKEDQSYTWICGNKANGQEENVSE